MKRFFLATIIAATALAQQPAPSAFIPSDELNKELPKWLRQRRQLQDKQR